MDQKLSDFGTRYAAAWSSQDPASLASLYSERGSLTVNAGPPSIGRAAITATARGFMTAFPNMLVKMDEVSQDGTHVIFRWTWTGTNSGPGGTGKFVRINGYEEWTMGADGLIAESKGNFDEAEYQRQLKSGASHTSRTGAVLFASSLDRVTAFYADVLGLVESSHAEDHILLESPGFQLVVHRIPEFMAATMQPSERPARRANAAFKPVFFVASLATVRAIVGARGGAMEPRDQEWSFNGIAVCDAVDPEGNVIQFRELGG